MDKEGIETMKKYLSDCCAKGHHNTIKGHKILITLSDVIWDSYPSERKTQIEKMIVKWFSFLCGRIGDLNTNDLGSICRDAASAYNHLADNWRDECHTTEVDR